MGKVFMSGIVPQKTAPITFKSNFADNDWSTIIKACQINKVPDTWTVGSQKTMTINGTDYAIDIIGKNHDTYSDGSGTAPLTFQMHDCYSTEFGINNKVSNIGGWADCYGRSNYVKTIRDYMPSAVKSALKTVNKYTSEGYKSSVIDTTADDVFPLSEVEVFGTTDRSFAGEGSQYEYYKAGNSKVKTVNGTAGKWWLRSPYKGDSNAFCCVITNGALRDQDANSTQTYHSIAFCF